MDDETALGPILLWLAGFLLVLFLAGMALAAIFPPQGW